MATKEKGMSVKEKTAVMLPLLNMNEFIVLDIETTNLSPEKGGRIIEIGAVKIINGEIVDRFEQLIDPEQKIYAKTTELTGITGEMVEGKPVIGQVLPKFHAFIGDAVVVAHNSGFDWDRFLLYFFKNVGIKPKNKVIDTVILSKHFFPKNDKHNLEVLTSTLGVTLSQHHRALADAQATGECLIKIIEKFGHTVEGLAEIAPTQKQSVTTEQLNLFGGSAEAPEQEVDTNQSKLNIRKVRYWEKPITKQKLYKRLYVNVNDHTLYGTVYFDIPTKTWYNKDFPGSLDFTKVQSLVISFLNLTTLEELCSFRN